MSYPVTSKNHPGNKLRSIMSTTHDLSFSALIIIGCSKGMVWRVANS